MISVAAELTGMHPQTLRIYERKGLLDPTRTSGGSRRFSESDLERLRHIQELTSTGLNLEGVRRVLQLEAELSRPRDELVQVRAQALDAVAATHRQYRRDLVPMRRHRCRTGRLGRSRFVGARLDCGRQDCGKGLLDNWTTGQLDN